MQFGIREVKKRKGFQLSVIAVIFILEGSTTQLISKYIHMHMLPKSVNKRGIQVYLIHR